ncbi:GRAM domain-containing protein [Suillus americanus]|nr:GRAM domain-containing protein [Suillus americanus]
MPSPVDGGARKRHAFSSRDDFSDGQTDTFASSEESEGSDDELDINEDIPVTGFAVASSKRNADFHELFPSIPEGDYLIEDYGCALQREILIQGRIYISENHICFHANIFGWITDLSIPIYEITALEKKMTAFVIPNAIQITTRQAKYTFASFLSRDTTYDVIANIWRLSRPDDTLSQTGSSGNIISPASTSDVSGPLVTSAGKETAPVPRFNKNKVTHCACSKNGQHLNEIALETVLPGTPDKIYNLMFASGFIKDFMRVDQKLMDVQISDWIPTGDNLKLLARNMSYIKPLNNSVGPKQTKCEIHDETLTCDFDDHVVMLTTTKTPDVPSGGVFSVKTKTCLMWASAISTRVIVSTQVDWTGRSFIKGLIEKSAIDGQKVYHSDLDKAMRMYIQEHQSEFIPAGVDPTAVAPVEPLSPVIELTNPTHFGGSSGMSDAAARKAREHERNRRGLQWAYETFDGAYGVAKRSTFGALELVKEAWEQSSSMTILYFVIVILVFSNLWTLMLVGQREEAGRRKEAKRTEEREKWARDIVSGLWEEMSVGRARGNIGSSGVIGVGGGAVYPGQVGGDWRSEVDAITSTLNAVEERVKLIRESLDTLN